MFTESKLKPLYASLKRLEIGDYLETKEFELFALENNFDEAWQDCKKEISRNKSVFILGYHNNEEEEDAFMLLMSTWFDQDYDTFEDFLLTTLINFAQWSSTKIDYTGVVDGLKHAGISKQNILDFTKDLRKVQANKPVKLEDTKIKFDKTPINITINSKKVFVVHGHDDKSRLELCNILKDDFKLEPVVLQEKPSNSIETIISKFERLASECSAAIILFTPDDQAGENKRARQNVIFELGYFLGRFQGENNRRLIILKKGSIETPSDISGVLYLEYSKAVKEVYYDLKKQFEHWGYSVS